MSNDYDAAWAERVATDSTRLNFHIRLGLRALAKRIRELEDKLGTNRQCNNCVGGIHGLCAGYLRCNCGCPRSREAA